MPEGALVIGVDCATDPRRVGLARGVVEGESLRLMAATTGAAVDPVDRIAGWMAEAPRTLLALDAPLGWPAPLADGLQGHRAGMPLAGAPNALFRRATDRSVHARLGKLPLEVGADRIARTAHAALALLSALRRRTGLALPLAWDPGLEQASATEVYPAATLRACGLPASGYKRPADAAVRRAILGGLHAHLSIPAGLEATLLGNADVLDATACLLAGLDFLRGRSMPPPDPAMARREGWIWVRERNG
ncbi:MAG: DUF429 domain-containing protein [Rhodothermales bacterium]|nr:DUF429 domain-containing protein [Rhodothermales bacterium]